MKNIENQRKNIIKLMMIIVATLIIASAVLSQDEFDFGDDVWSDQDSISTNFNLQGNNPCPVSFSIKLTGNRQVATYNEKWIDVGPSIYSKLDYFSSFGQIYGEGSFRWNSAYQIEGSNNSTRNKYEYELTVRELFWKKPYASCTVSVGNQVVLWSRADFLTQTDRISVYDLSRRMFDEVEDVMMGQNIVRFDKYSKCYNWSMVLVPYPRYNRTPDSDHPYSISPSYSLDREEEKRNPEAAFRFETDLAKGSVALLAGRVNNRTPILKTNFSAGKIAIYKQNVPFNFFGIMTEWAFEPFLLKGEFVYDQNRPIQKFFGGIPSGYERQDVVGFVVGYDFNMGLAGTFIHEFSSEIIQNERNDSTNEMAMGWSKDLMNDRLGLSFMAMWLDSPENFVGRAQVSWDVNNNIQFTWKYVGFSIGESKQNYGQLENLDRLDFSLEIFF